MEQATLGARIKELRKARHMTQEELAWRAQVTQATLCHIETGKSHSQYSTLWRIADALGVSVDTIYGKRATFRDRIMQELEQMTNEEFENVINPGGELYPNLCPADCQYRYGDDCMCKWLEEQMRGEWLNRPWDGEPIWRKK